jgi:hypothetical protein
MYLYIDAHVVIEIPLVTGFIFENFGTLKQKLDYCTTI